MKKNILLISTILAASLIATHYLNNNKTIPQSELSVIQNVAMQNNCESLANQVKQLLDEVNYCNKDSDCTITSFGCPFDCNNLVNINENLDLIQKGADKYSESCGNCLYKCGIPPTQQEVVCKNNKCVVIRYDE